MHLCPFFGKLKLVQSALKHVMPLMSVKYCFELHLLFFLDCFYPWYHSNKYRKIFPAFSALEMNLERNHALVQVTSI